MTKKEQRQLAFLTEFKKNLNMKQSLRKANIKTIYNWYKRDKEFRAKYNELRNNLKPLKLIDDIETKQRQKNRDFLIKICFESLKKKAENGELHESTEVDILGRLDPGLWARTENRKVLTKVDNSDKENWNNEINKVNDFVDNNLTDNLKLVKSA